jgi:hypothetical protein
MGGEGRFGNDAFDALILLLAGFDRGPCAQRERRGYGDWKGPCAPRPGAATDCPDGPDGEEWKNDREDHRKVDDGGMERIGKHEELRLMIDRNIEVSSLTDHPTFADGAGALAGCMVST